MTAVTPVPSLPSSAEASQASVYPPIRENSFSIKSRDEHEPLTTLTTVRNYLKKIFFFKKCFFIHNNIPLLVFLNFFEYHLTFKHFFISFDSSTWQNGTTSIQRHLIPPQPGRKRKTCGGTDEVSAAAKVLKSKHHTFYCYFGKKTMLGIRIVSF